MQLGLNRRTVVLAVCVLGVGGFVVMWMRSPPPKARRLRPLLTEIDKYVSTNGGYPTSCVSFVAFSGLTQHFSVYTGERDADGISWQPRDVSGHDFTIMVDKSGYEIFLPVGRMKMISFSSFPVWRFDSSARNWQKGRIHWSYAGSYWSRD